MSILLVAESIDLIMGGVTVFVKIVTTIINLNNIINYYINIHYQIKKIKVNNFKIQESDKYKYYH